MNKNHLYDQVHRELTRERMNPAPESFYEGVWHRIRNKQQAAAPERNYRNARVSFGVVCWRAVPVLGAFLLAASLYLWDSPLETETQSPNTVESYVLDSGEIPTNGDLLYQIMFSYDKQGSEKNP